MIDLNSLVEVKLSNEDDFLKVKETLTRIGIASKESKRLCQSCHILHKRGQYYITHFKELFALDGRPTNITQDDLARRNTIVNLLAEWGLVTLVDPAKSATNVAPLSVIKVLSYGEKDDWTLEAKYTIGSRK